MISVLDASALLAYLGNEPGAQVVTDALAEGAVISAVNLAEVLSTVAARGGDPAALATELAARGLLGGALTLEPFGDSDAIETARLRPLTRAAGLSLGDRACLALGHRRRAPVLTADVAWVGIDPDLDIRTIR